MSCISGASPRQPYAGLDVRVAPGAYNALGPNINCMNAPNDGVFRWMTVAIDDSQVQELKLFSEVLQQDSLFLYFGAPDAIGKSGSDSRLDLYWDRGTYSVTASVQVHDLVVKLVTLAAKK
jgi:hypothetical protein